MLDAILVKLAADGRTEARGAEVFITNLVTSGFDFEHYSTVNLFNALSALGYDTRDVNCFNIATIIDSATVV